MKTLLISLLTLNLTISNVTTNNLDRMDWKLIKECPSVHIFNTQQSNRKFKTFRIKGKINSDIKTLESILDQTSYLVDWFPMASKAELISRPSLNKMVVKITFDFPFPMQNRDAYIEVIKTRTSKNKLSFSMVLANGYPTNPGFERLSMLESITTIKNNNGSVIIDQITYLNPGGNMPKMFLNNGLPSCMIKSLGRLVALTQKRIS